MSIVTEINDAHIQESSKVTILIQYSKQYRAVRAGCYGNTWQACVVSFLGDLKSRYAVWEHISKMSFGHHVRSVTLGHKIISIKYVH